MDQTSFDDPGNDLRASKLVRGIGEFLLTIADRADEAHARNVKNGEVLDGKRIGQTPERFLEEQFIRECIEILGYEKYRPQPKGYDGLGEQVPDFELVDAKHLLIGELKKPNEFTDSRNECREYLRQFNQPAAGIATDGFMWLLYLTTGDGIVDEQAKVRLSKPVHRLSLEHLHEKGARRDRRLLRESVYELVETFEKTRLETRIEQSL